MQCWALLASRLCQKQQTYKNALRTAVKLSFKHFGDSLEPNAPAVIVLHGLFGNRRHWQSISKTLQNMTKLAVISVDLRNHGKSPNVESHKYMKMAEDVLLLLERLGIDEAFLLGHCMGGRVAMSIALMKPEIVAGLIIVDISPVSSCREFLYAYPKIIDAMLQINLEDRRDLKHVRDARRLVKKEFRKLKLPKEVMNKDVLFSNIIRKKKGFGWSCNLYNILHEYKYVAVFPKPLLNRTYMGPVIFIGGQNSDFIPPDDLPRIRELFPKATVIYLPKTGHYLFHDDMKGFLEIVINFIKIVLNK